MQHPYLRLPLELLNTVLAANDRALELGGCGPVQHARIRHPAGVHRHPFCRTFRDTVSVMTDLISVRLDTDAQRALAELEATGLSRSEAVRRGLVTAAQRLRDRQRLIDEVAELVAEEADRTEAAEVSAMMEDLRAAW